MRAFVLLSILGLALAGPVSAAEETDQRGVAERWKGPGNGYTILDFSASWCRPCWKVLPKLEEYAKAHPDVRVIAVSVDDDVLGRDLLVKKLALTIPVLWDGEHRIAKYYSPAGMPATFVLDPNGEVVHRHVGSGPKEWDALVAFLAKASAR